MPPTIIIFLALIATVTAHCSCNSAVRPEADPTSLSNAAQQILSIAITLLNGAPAIPHQLALVTGAMFEASQISRGKPQLTPVEVEFLDLSNDQAVGYAGYAALSRALASDAVKTAALDAAASEIGLSSTMIRDTIGMAIARAIAMKYPLNIPPPPYAPPNPPSTTQDAKCGDIVDFDGWQPLCVTPRSGGPCQPQMVPFRPLVNASLITADGEQKVDNLISSVPPPNTFSTPLGTFPDTDNEFTRDYNRVLDASRRLNDRRKITAEVFAPNAALGVHRLALDEAATRGVGLARSVGLFFTLSAAVRDGFIGSSTVKVRYSTIRAITVFQCGFRNRMIRVWQGRYKGVGKFGSSEVSQFRPYIQTPPFPGYISGHTTIAGAAARVLTRYFGRTRPKGSNCFIVGAGGSVIEGKKESGDAGFIEGVTDVANSGRLSVGFSPASETTVRWSSFNEYGRLVAKSRLFGGVHTPNENVLGLRLGAKAGNLALRLVKSLK